MQSLKVGMMPNDNHRRNNMSNFRKRVKKQKEQLMKRTKEQHDSKDDQGGSFGTVFIKEKIPEGVQYWRPGKDDHIIDIIPFIAGKNHPNVPAGELAYVVDMWVHRNVGGMNDQYICPAKNFKRPCPICEYISKERLPKVEWDKHRAYRRTAYLVWIRDEGDEEAKGIQIFEVSHFFFEKEIDDRAKKKRGGGYVVFSDPDDGMSISFTVKSSGSYIDSGGTKRESVEFAGHQFEPRDTPIPDKILDLSFCLDDAIRTRPDYEEMSKAFHGGGVEKDESGEDDLPEDDLPEDEPEVDEPEVDEPKKEKKKAAKSKDSDGCPHGHTFGEDIDKEAECEECANWDNCSDEADKLAGD